MTLERSPLVSVIMPVYNGEKYLAEAIDSILTQTFTDFEFIIVDDGSQDRSAEIVRSYEARDDRIRCVMLERNIGDTSARNRGLGIAKGEFMTGMDCDDVSQPERLRKQVDFLRANPAIGALGTCGIMTDEDLKPYRNWDVPEHHALIAYDMFIGQVVLCSSLMIRRDVVEAAGGFEPSRKRGADIEWVSRLIAQTRFANLPDRLSLYRQHGGQDHTPRAEREYAELMGRLLFMLWGEAPQASFDRFARVRRREKLSWRQRRLAKRDILRLIEAMIASNWLAPADRSFLHRVLNRQLEETTPRAWQMFCHWRRHHFGELGRPEKPR